MTMLRSLCLLMIWMLVLTACGGEGVERMDAADRRAFLDAGFPMGDGPMAVRIIWPGEAFVVESTTTAPGDAWVMAEIVSHPKWNYSDDGERGLWLMTDDGGFFCANDVARKASVFPDIEAVPTDAQMRVLTEAVVDTYPTDIPAGMP